MYILQCVNFLNKLAGLAGKNGISGVSMYEIWTKKYKYITFLQCKETVKAFFFIIPLTLIKLRAWDVPLINSTNLVRNIH